MRMPAAEQLTRADLAAAIGTDITQLPLMRAGRQLRQVGSDKNLVVCHESPTDVISGRIGQACYHACSPPALGTVTTGTPWYGALTGHPDGGGCGHRADGGAAPGSAGCRRDLGVLPERPAQALCLLWRHSLGPGPILGP